MSLRGKSAAELDALLTFTKSEIGEVSNQLVDLITSFNQDEAQRKSELLLTRCAQGTKEEGGGGEKEREREERRVEEWKVGAGC